MLNNQGVTKWKQVEGELKKNGDEYVQDGSLLIDVKIYREYFQKTVNPDISHF